MFFQAFRLILQKPHVPRYAPNLTSLDLKAGFSHFTAKQQLFSKQDWKQNHFTAITTQIFNRLFLFQPTSHHPFRSQSLVTLIITKNKFYKRVNLAKIKLKNRKLKHVLGYKEIKSETTSMIFQGQISYNRWRNTGKKAVANIHK